MFVFLVLMIVIHFTNGALVLIYMQCILAFLLLIL